MRSKGIAKISVSRLFLIIVWLIMATNLNILMCEAGSSLIPTQVGSGTEINGIISEDTTWVEGYYLVTAHILVPEGVTLTIDPGVEISLEDHFIQIDGTLRAIGTENKTIIITGSGTSDGSMVFTETSVNWNEDNRTGSILEYCEFSSISGLAVKINSGSFPKISNCLIKGASDAIRAHGGLIVNNTITNNGRGIMTFGSHHLRETSIYPKIFIIDNIISNNALGIYVCDGYYSPIIVKNVISDNRGNLGDGGIRIDGSKPEIRNNTIYNNSPNGILIGTYVGTNLSINYNNIYDNSDYDVFLYDFPYEINASYNWWGSINTTVIEDNIYDFNEDFRLGNVIYKPILQNPIINFEPEIESEPEPELEPEPEPEPEPEFEVSDLTITPVEIDLGDEVTISFTITNTDSRPYVFVPFVQIGDTMIMEDVELEGHESRTVSHTITPESAGDYDVTIDGLEESFTVKPKPSFWDKIPGFPYESIIIGLTSVIIILWYTRARNLGQTMT